MTLQQIIGCAALVLFGIVLNWWVAEEQKYNVGDFSARYVIGGVSITIIVMMIDGSGLKYDSITWGILSFIHFACSGTPMAIGSWQRRKH